MKSRFYVPSDWSPLRGRWIPISSPHPIKFETHHQPLIIKAACTHLSRIPILRNTSHHSVGPDRLDPSHMAPGLIDDEADWPANLISSQSPNPAGVKPLAPPGPNTNYGNWAFAMDLFLRDANLAHVLTETSQTDRPESWDRDCLKVCTILSQCSDESNYQYMRPCGTDARLMWLSLQEAHHNASSEGRIYWLQCLMSSQMIDDDLERHITYMCHAFERLKAVITPQFPLTADNVFASALLTSLSADWAGIVGSLSQRPDIDPTTIIREIRREVESKKKSLTTALAKVPIPTTQPTNAARPPRLMRDRDHIIPGLTSDSHTSSKETTSRECVLFKRSRPETLMAHACSALTLAQDSPKQHLPSYLGYAKRMIDSRSDNRPDELTGTTSLTQIGIDAHADDTNHTLSKLRHTDKPSNAPELPNLSPSEAHGPTADPDSTTTCNHVPHKSVPTRSLTAASFAPGAQSSTTLTRPLYTFVVRDSTSSRTTTSPTASAPGTNTPGVVDRSCQQDKQPTKPANTFQTRGYRDHELNQLSSPRNHSLTPQTPSHRLTTPQLGPTGPNIIGEVEPTGTTQIGILPLNGQMVVRASTKPVQATNVTDSSNLSQDNEVNKYTQQSSSRQTTTASDTLRASSSRAVSSNTQPSKSSQANATQRFVIADSSYVT